ncbi:hypothetical protein [Porphyromonas levii]|uniref:Uncharacterized protein n=1 Tax=Porphyromonas levii TaxID=28114 RepID=A0A4Y8WLR8_9PORP|nr:hypothetical protein [Porphyromonas levii]MDN4754844.1 hypothetical protein [Porphyromonadaceae bacterium W3.11]TFH93972.1 hypothetical protein E4P47_09475 [Porphyromonas levii]TFH94841.1 hypothetical protein E4P48_09530 [Porphyromonas levii]
MNKNIINRDPHEPAFLPFEKATPQAPVEPELTKSQFIRCRLRQLFYVALIAGILYGGYRLLVKILTPEVLTIIGIIVSFLILRWVVRIVLRIAFTILSFIFWFIIICALLFVVL